VKVEIKTGLLDIAVQVFSPNYDDRPAPGNIDLLVVHGISLPPGEFGGLYIDALFTNTLDPEVHPYFRTIEGMKVSAHALIRRDGSITQFVPFHLRAWHAGESCFESRSCCNDFSIGIELEGSDDVPYSDAQYATLANLARALMKAYPALNPQRIVGHSEIAPGRKTDPGAAFDWPRLRALLA
jgi:AmpD protein